VTQLVLWLMFKEPSKRVTSENSFNKDKYDLSIFYTFSTINDTETLKFLEHAVTNICLLKISTLVMSNRSL